MLPELYRIHDYLLHYAEVQPQKDSLVFEDRRLSYRALADAVIACAHSLLARGVNKGDRVATLSTPRPEHFIIFLATTMIGGVWVGLNPRHTYDELHYLINDARPRILFSILTFEQRTLEPDLRRLKSRLGFACDMVAIDGSPQEGITAFDHFIRLSRPNSGLSLQDAQGAVRSKDAAAIIYTSGTTGKPKGVVLSHYSFIRGYLVQYRHWKIAPLKLLNNLPISHIASLGDLSVYGLIAGGTIVYMERFLAEKLLETIERERITFLQQFPTQYQLLLDALELATRDLSSVKVIAWGGAAASRELILRLARLGTRLYNSYGLTECGAPILFTEDGASMEILADTVGRPDPRYSVSIVDNFDHVLPAGEPGEILVHGDTFMTEYFNLPNETRGTISPDGWLRTGDVGFRRADGNIQLVGRLKEMYKSGGYSVYPREIESVLEQHSAIVMAAVVAVPDALFHEVGHAFLVSSPSAERNVTQIAKYCREHLANYKVPKRFSFVEALPLLPNGKVDKLALRNLAHTT